MATHGDRFGRQRGRGDWGQGAQLQQVPKHGVKIYGDFSGGFNYQAAREVTQPNASFDSLDMQVTTANELTRLPGAITQEVLAGHNPAQLALHPSLSLTSELLMFDPPYLGVKGTGATVWTDEGLIGDRYFAWTNYGETFVFMNGAGAVRKREPGAASTVALENAPQGRTVATFAGRLFIGGSYVEGNYEPVGISWSSSTGDLDDWAADDSSFELLLDNVVDGDRIVALRTMGLNLMAILLRKSVWIGRFTGDPSRPAAFEPRVAGVGCVNDQTARNTKEGVLFLSDTGVQLFDGNSVAMISKPINDLLLPLDKDKLEEYSAVFNPISRRYHLFTPTETFILDMEYQRWYRSSIIARSAVLFPNQVVGLTWENTGGTWESQGNTTWIDLAPLEENGGSLMYLGVQAGTPAIAKETEDHPTYMDLPLTPYWCFPFEEGPERNWLHTIHAILFDYVGSGRVKFHLPDIEGEYAEAASMTLAVAPRLRTAWLPLTTTGKGVSAKLEILLGSPKISVVQLRAALRGPRMEAIPFEPREYYDDFDV